MLLVPSQGHLNKKNWQWTLPCFKQKYQFIRKQGSDVYITYIYCIWTLLVKMWEWNESLKPPPRMSLETNMLKLQTYYLTVSVAWANFLWGSRLQHGKKNIRWYRTYLNRLANGSLVFIGFPCILRNQVPFFLNNSSRTGKFMYFQHSPPGDYWLNPYLIVLVVWSLVLQDPSLRVYFGIFGQVCRV